MGLTFTEKPVVASRPVGQVMGIDPSLTNTGLVVIDSHGGLVEAENIKPPKGIKGWERLRWICDRLQERLIVYKPVNQIAIEWYAMDKAQGLVGLVEVGTMIRYRLLELGLSWADTTPGQLKKFATGKGNCKKEEVMLGVFKHWRFDPADNNQADAYVLAQIARGLAWQEIAQTKIRWEILQSIAQAPQLT